MRRMLFEAGGELAALDEEPGAGLFARRQQDVDSIRAQGFLRRELGVLPDASRMTGIEIDLNAFRAKRRRRIDRTGRLAGGEAAIGAAELAKCWCSGAWICNLNALVGVASGLAESSSNSSVYGKECLRPAKVGPS